jgi:hypothetical protein
MSYSRWWRHGRRVVRVAARRNAHRRGEKQKQKQQKIKNWKGPRKIPFVIDMRDAYDALWTCNQKWISLFLFDSTGRPCTIDQNWFTFSSSSSSSSLRV